MAQFSDNIRNLRGLSGRLLADARNIATGIAEAAGGVLRGVFFKIVNALVPLVPDTVPAAERRTFASNIAQHLNDAVRAARDLQSEHEGTSRREAIIPVSSRLGPDEFRITASAQLDIPDMFEGTIYLSYRGEGIPSRDELLQGFAAQLETLEEDYEVPITLGRNLHELTYLFAEGGG